MIIGSIMPTKPKSVKRPWDLKPRYSKKHERKNRKRLPYNTKRWQNLRLIILRDQPLCMQCIKDGRNPRASTVCDHIDNELKYIDFWDKNNLQGLCTRCHSRKSQRERGGGSDNFA